MSTPAERFAEWSKTTGTASVEPEGPEARFQANEKKVAERSSRYHTEYPTESAIVDTAKGIGESVAGVAGGLVSAIPYAPEALDKLAMPGDYTRGLLSGKIGQRVSAEEFAIQKSGGEEKWGNLSPLQQGVRTAASSFVDPLVAIGSGLLGKAKPRAALPARTNVEDIAAAQRTLGGKMDVPLLPAEATTSRLIDTLHNTAESSMSGGGFISRYKAKRQGLLKKEEDNIIASYGKAVPPSDIGDMYITTQVKKLETSRAPAKTIYKALETDLDPVATTVQAFKEEPFQVTRYKDVPSPAGVVDAYGKPTMVKTPYQATVMRQVPFEKEVLVGGAKIETESLRNFARPIEERARITGNTGPARAGDAVIKDMAELPESLTYTQAQEFRTRLQSVVSEFSVTHNDAVAVGRAEHGISLLTKSMKAGIKDFSPEGAELWDMANAIYRRGSEDFNNKLARTLVKQADAELGGAPENMLKWTFGAGPTRVHTIQKVLGGVDSPEWKVVLGGRVKQIFEESQVQGMTNGVKLAESLRKATLQGVFLNDSKRLARMKDLATTIKATQESQGAGPGLKTVLALSQGGVVVAAASGVLAPKALIVLLGPAALSKLMLNPKTANLMINGFKTPLSNRARAGAIRSALLAEITPGSAAGAESQPSIEPEQTDQMQYPAGIP